MGQLGMDNPYALATMGTHDQDWTKYIHTHTQKNNTMRKTKKISSTEPPNNLE
jgi:hypothetical protein